MDKKSLKVLEYNKIIDLLSIKASSSLGLKYIEELTPSPNYEEVKDMLEETSEAQSILVKRGHVNLGGIQDVSDSVKRAEIGAVLDPGSLLKISGSLRAARNLKRSLSPGDEEDFNYPRIQSLSNALYVYREIEEEIDKNLLFMALDKLSDREKQIMELRFGLTTRGNEKTQKEVASILGISQSYISRLEKKIISRLKKEMKKFV